MLMPFMINGGSFIAVRVLAKGRGQQLGRGECWMMEKSAWGSVQSEPQGCGVGRGGQEVCVCGGIITRIIQDSSRDFSLSDQTFPNNSLRAPKAAWEGQGDCRVCSPPAHP